MAGRRLVEAAPHVLGLGRELARLRLRVSPRTITEAGHDIGREAALDDAEVRGGLGVHAAEPHRRRSPPLATGSR